MALNDVVAGLKQKFTDAKDAVAKEVAGYDETLGQLDQVTALADVELKAAEEKGYDEGLKAANQAGGSDKLYSDAEMNQFLQDREDQIRAVLKTEFDAQKAEIEALKSQVTSVQESEAKKLEEFKAEAFAKYKEQQVAETAGETGYVEFLKPTTVEPSPTPESSGVVTASASRKK